MTRNARGRRTGASGGRHWFQITGLPGWERVRIGVPAFGKAHCARQHPANWRRRIASKRGCLRVKGSSLIGFLRKLWDRRKSKCATSGSENPSAVSQGKS